MSGRQYVTISPDFLLCWVREDTQPKKGFIATHVWTYKDNAYWMLWIRRRNDAPKDSKLRAIVVASATRKFQTDDLDQDIPY